MCLAASGPTQHSLARWWTPALSASEATVTRLAVPVPSAAGSLHRGCRTSSGRKARRSNCGCPPAPRACSSPCRAMPGRCRWTSRARRWTSARLLRPSRPACSTGKGARSSCTPPRSSRTQAEVIAIDPTPRRETLERLYEAVSSAPGQQSLVFTVAGAPRLLTVSGALRCVTTLDDGSRLEGCEAKVPAGRSGELVLDRESGGVRAVLAPPAGLRSRRARKPRLPGGRRIFAAVPALRAEWLSRGPHLHPRRRRGRACARRLRRVWPGPGQRTVIRVRGHRQGLRVRPRCLRPGSYRAGRPRLRGPGALRHPRLDAGAREGAKEGVANEESWITPADALLPVPPPRRRAGSAWGSRCRRSCSSAPCSIRMQRVLGEGCQQFLRSTRAATCSPSTRPPPRGPSKFKPVLVGLAGAKAEVPEEYLRDFFQRIGENP